MAKNLSFKQRLKQIGLSENEANVYLCVLEKGRTTPKEIAEETGLNHTTSYRVLKYLVKKSLVSMAKEGEKKLFFSVEDPDRIRDYLKGKRQELREQEEYLDDLMPSLKTIYKGHRYLKIDFFEGKEGVYWLQKEMAKLANEVSATYGIVPIDQAEESFPRRKNDPRTRWDKFDGELVAIYSTNDPSKFSKKETQKQKIKVVQNEVFNSNIELAVVKDYVYFIIYEGDIGGILIKDQQISIFFKELIKFIYKSIPI